MAVSDPDTASHSGHIVAGHLKSPVRNCLSVHLNTAVRLFTQNVYTIENFDYAAAFENWKAGTGPRGRYSLTEYHSSAAGKVALAVARAAARVSMSSVDECDDCDVLE